MIWNPFRMVSQEESRRIYQAQVAYCLSRPIVKTDAEWRALKLGDNPLTAETILRKAKKSKPEAIASEMCLPLRRVLDVIETGDSPARPMSDEDRETYEAWVKRISRKGIPQ